MSVAVQLVRSELVGRVMPSNSCWLILARAGESCARSVHGLHRPTVVNFRLDAHTYAAQHAELVTSGSDELSLGALSDSQTQLSCRRRGPRHDHKRVDGGDDSKLASAGTFRSGLASNVGGRTFEAPCLAHRGVAVRCPIVASSNARRGDGGGSR